MTITKAHFEYLDDLRASGEANMFGAGSYVREEFGMDWMEARYVVTSWIKTFDESKAIEERVKEANLAGNPT